MNKQFFLYFILALSMIIVSCGGRKTNKKIGVPDNSLRGASCEVKLITLDPGHFHAALIQKSMYKQVDPIVHVYAPEGEELKAHLQKINDYNSRSDQPTAWIENVYSGDDYIEKMIADKKGNLVVISGNNRLKTAYIKKSVEAGLNVLADKPMVITAENFPVLEEAFRIAEQKGVLLFDDMMERYEITTILQRELSQVTEIFGTLRSGNIEHPAVEEISIHHFYKNVSGKPMIRPTWFFDVKQEGEGIVDVTTHLVDLVQWGCFPEQVIHKSDIEILRARHWRTEMKLGDFKEVTGKNRFPDFLSDVIKDGKLNVFSNGEILYKIKGFVAKVSVEWRFKAPEGTADTHYSIMRGCNCNLEIRQGEIEKFVPTLYVNAIEGADLTKLASNIKRAIQNSRYVGLGLDQIDDFCWKVIIPDKYKVGHEAHFSQVTEKYLEYLKQGKLPDWEVPNMIAKYFTTTQALELAKKSTD